MQPLGDGISGDQQGEEKDQSGPAVEEPAGEAELQRNADKFKADISSKMKDKGDLFDEMIVHEEHIRLGEDGWKPRYYQVSHQACFD